MVESVGANGLSWTRFRGGHGVSFVVKLEYRIEEWWPARVRFVEDATGCSLNVGALPAFFVFGMAGIWLAIAVMSATSGGYAFWRGWQLGAGVDLEFIVLKFVAVPFSGGMGAVVLRWQLRHGHLPVVYRLDVARSAFLRRTDVLSRWQEWEADRIQYIRVQNVRLPGGWVVGVLLLVRLRGKRLPLAAVFWRGDQKAVERFTERVKTLVGSRTVNVLDI